MSDKKKVNIVPPEELKLGDVISCALAGWGSLRVVVTVTGLATGKRPENLNPCIGVGTLMEDFKDEDHTIEKAGTSVMLYWPTDRQMEDDAKRADEGFAARLSPVLIERSGDEIDAVVQSLQPSTLDQLSELAAGLDGLGSHQSGTTQRELRSPDVLKLTVRFHGHVTCEKCGEGSRPCWYYPMVDKFRCATHRDKSLQDPAGQPWEHETVVAWDDNPMDAHHF